MTPLQAALRYAAIGWRVLPLWPRQKTPHGLQAPRGCHDATTDERCIRAWWRVCSDLNVGIATGGGLVVIDLDVSDDGEPVGELELERLEAEYGALPETRTVQTASGGVHLYYGLPEGIVVKNSASKVAPKIDIRGDGGYVVAPPSVVEDGRWRWVRGGELAMLPSLWITPMVAPKRDDAEIASHACRGPRKNLSAYLQAALAYEAQRVRDAPEGAGNMTLNSAAFSLGTLEAHGLSRTDAECALWSALATWERPMRASAAEKTIRSGWRAGVLRPRDLRR
jgi:hypothetical protein